METYKRPPLPWEKYKIPPQEEKVIGSTGKVYINLWKNTRKPPFMESTEQGLSSDKVLFAVKNMTLAGLQIAASYGLLFMAKTMTPKEISSLLEQVEEKK